MNLQEAARRRSIGAIWGKKRQMRLLDICRYDCRQCSLVQQQRGRFASCLAMPGYVAAAVELPQGSKSSSQYAPVTFGVWFGT